VSASSTVRPTRRVARSGIPVSRVLIYFCSLLIVIWSVGPFLWQLSTSLQ